MMMIIFSGIVFGGKQVDQMWIARCEILEPIIRNMFLRGVSFCLSN
jgi:hypothetical protein